MKVYLAGKIARYDWRHLLVPGLRDQFEAYEGSYRARAWPTLPMARLRGDHWTVDRPFDGLSYVGPYFATCDHACTHGPDSDHAWIGGGCIPTKQPTRTTTAQLCRDAIDQADVVFAWMENGHTAFGTLVEIGYAYAKGKTVVLAHPPGDYHIEPVDSDCAHNGDEWEAWRYGYEASGHHGGALQGSDDLWFAYEHATDIIESLTAVDAFEVWVARSERSRLWDRKTRDIEKLESPLEKDFYAAYLNKWNSLPAEMHAIEVQYDVVAQGNSYRLDFALPDKKIAFEMDGYTYHGKEREHFNRDRRRDLDLKLDGWEVHRFDGDMIRDNPFQVVDIAVTLAGLR